MVSIITTEPSENYEVIKSAPELPDKNINVFFISKCLTLQVNLVVSIVTTEPSENYEATKSAPELPRQQHKNIVFLFRNV